MALYAQGHPTTPKAVVRFFHLAKTQDFLNTHAPFVYVHTPPVLSWRRGTTERANTIYHEPIEELGHVSARLTDLTGERPSLGDARLR